MERTPASPKRKLAGKIEDAPTGGVIRIRVSSSRGSGTNAEGRKSITVDGRSVCTLPGDVVERLGLTSGLHWSPDIAERVLRAAEEDRARRAAVRLLDVRLRSRGELLDRLRRAGVSESLRIRIVEELVRAGKVSDDAFARAYARSIASKPAGARLIERKLRARQVDRDLAKRAAGEALAGRDPLSEATALARRRAAAMPAKLDAATRARRLLGLLARRGFDHEVAADAVRAVVRVSDEPS